MYRSAITARTVADSTGEGDLLFIECRECLLNRERVSGFGNTQNGWFSYYIDIQLNIKPASRLHI
jgi:hypothetical protein